MGDFVYIGAAGRGSRLGARTDQINKALLPVNKKAAISWIIDGFAVDTKFVVSLGYQGSHVRNFLEVAHPNRDVTFVEVEHWSGERSGPGHSLLKAREFLPREFFFVSCDTLWEGALPNDRERDWLAYSGIEADQSTDYCTLILKGDRVIGLRDKIVVERSSAFAFTGLCFIKRYNQFWQALDNPNSTGYEHQITDGLQYLVDRGQVKGYELAWTDIGTFEKYRAAVTRYEDYDFSKSDELLYISDRRVIKFFGDEEICKKRVMRATCVEHVFPEIERSKGSFYSYRFQPGATLYERNSIHIFHELLEWLDRNVWQPRKILSSEFQNLCDQFYREKTMARIAQYEKKYQGRPDPEYINGEDVPSLRALLSDFPWHELRKGIPRFIHGDLQFDNIIVHPKSGFTLLDWRHEFAGQIDVGDLYYDLAKMNGGIEICYDYIKKNLFSYEENGDSSHLDFATRASREAFQKVLASKVRSLGASFEKVKVITALIFINMAPLHNFPFDRLLHAYGRLSLHHALGSADD